MFEETKPKLLLIHGFSGTGCMYYRMIKHLIKFYWVTTIDLLGQGCSGTPPFGLAQSEESVDYFMLSIEAWMQTVDYRSTPYILLAYSFGAYLSSFYATRYPEKIDKVIMLSPLGLVSKPESEILNEFM